MKKNCIYVLMHKKVNRDAGVMGDSIYRFYSPKLSKTGLRCSGTILEGGVLFIDQEAAIGSCSCSGVLRGGSAKSGRFLVRTRPGPPGGYFPVPTGPRDQTSRHATLQPNSNPDAGADTT